MIYTTGIHTTDPHYYISFVDSLDINQELEIDRTLFQVLDRFELDDLSFLNEVDNHYEHSKITDKTLNDRVLNPPKTVEEIAEQNIQNELLYEAISKLPKKQRARLILYYFENLTYSKIAELEGCTIMPIKRSIDAAIKNLKKFLK